MTCIAFDGNTLAADSRIMEGSRFFDDGLKIKEITNDNGFIGLIGFAGSFSVFPKCCEWIIKGENEKEYPLKTIDDGSCFILVTEDILYIYECGEHGFIAVPNSRKYAIGSGGKYAEAVMHLGGSAVEAVEVAIALDACCGGEVITLSI